MTVALGSPTDTATDTPVDEWKNVGRPAGWWSRAAAFGIDVLCPMAAVVTLLLVGWSAPRAGWLWWLCIALAAALVVATAVNRVVIPGNTGWSLGRSIVGIEVANRDDGDDPGPVRLLLRDLAHVLDTVPLALGWLWPLLDARGRTFADMLVGTEVREVEGTLPDRRQLATAVVGGAAAVSVLAAGVGYAAVYRHQQTLATARDQIADEGPKIVADMLSYTVKEAPNDFAHAQTLVTDGYRPELIKQQEAVQKSGLVDNDYWVSNSAVLSSTADKAAMLLLLQGQRGVAPQQRFVSASLRVDYEKVGDAWKVSNLSVLSAPKPPPAPAPPASATPKPDQPKPDQPKPDQPKPAPKPEPKPAPPKPSAGGR